MIPCFQEKPRVENIGCSYRKPTQVGGESIPRRLREPWLRNSAYWHRNLGIRCASKVKDLASGANGGRSDQGLTTVYQKHRSLLTRKRKYRG